MLVFMGPLEYGEPNVSRSSPSFGDGRRITLKFVNAFSPCVSQTETMSERVYIANFGRGNWAWPDSLRRKIIFVMDDVRAHPFWLASDREGFIREAQWVLRLGSGGQSPRMEFQRAQSSTTPIQLPGRRRSAFTTRLYRSGPTATRTAAYFDGMVLIPAPSNSISPNEHFNNSPMTMPSASIFPLAKSNRPLPHASIWRARWESFRPASQVVDFRSSLTGRKG